MASPSSTKQFINNTEVLNLTMNEKETLQLPNTDVEDDAIKRTQSLQSLNELESDLSKNKYCTDADVLKAVCVFSPESPVKNTIDERETTLQTGFLEVQSEIFADNISVNSLEYWSDEEGCYPPQMSLSPPPGEPTFRKTTLTTVKETKEFPQENELVKNVKTTDGSKEAARFDDLDLSKSSLKRSHVRSLSPITSKYPPYHSHPHKNQSIRGGPETMSPNITPSLLINSTESVAKSMTSSQLYNWEPRPPFDWGISSPSLIRPAGFTPPRTRKHHSSHTTEVFALSYSNRMKDDKLFDKQRSLMQKRKVSRSQSSYATASNNLFPEISSIAKTQAASKSISDFRQSSSIFGKLMKKNSLKETSKFPNDRKKDLDSDKPSKVADTTSTSSSGKRGETTRRKLRRILSLH